jgi:hypothetical protein
MSTSNLERKWQPTARKDDNLATNCELIVGASTSHNPVCLHGMLERYLYLFTIHSTIWSELVDRVVEYRTNKNLIFVSNQDFPHMIKIKKVKLSP